MSKLAKRVSYPFTEGQPLLPASERLTVPSKEDVIAFYRTHERVSWNLTEVIDLDWRDIDLDALTKTDVDVVETVMLVESNNPRHLRGQVDAGRPRRAGPGGGVGPRPGQRRQVPRKAGSPVVAEVGGVARGAALARLLAGGGGENQHVGADVVEQVTDGVSIARGRLS